VVSVGDDDENEDEEEMGDELPRCEWSL
jgi:hypothetical protein